MKTPYRSIATHTRAALTHTIYVITFAYLVLASSAHASQGSHSAHVHGEAQLNIAMDQNTIHLEFTSPAYDIVGFEHSPNNPSQEAQIHQALEKLQNGSAMFTFTRDADCTMTNSDVHSGLDHQQDHGDFTARYTFTCTSPEKLTSLDLQLFSAFKGLETVHVQLITNSYQQGMEVHANGARIPLDQQ